MAGLKWFSHALLVVVLERLGIIQSPTTWWATASVSSGVSLGERGEEMLHCLSARNHFYTSNTTICPLRWKIDFWCEVSQHVSVTKEWGIQILLPTKVLTTIPLAGALLFYQGQRFKYGSKVGRSQTGYERDVYLAHWPWKKPFEDQSRFAWTLRKCETKNLSKFTLISIHAGSSLGVKIWMIQFVPCQVMLIYGLTCCMCACHTIYLKKKTGKFLFRFRQSSWPWSQMISNKRSGGVVMPKQLIWLWIVQLVQFGRGTPWRASRTWPCRDMSSPPRWLGWNRFRTSGSWQREWKKSPQPYLYIFTILMVGINEDVSSFRSPGARKIGMFRSFSPQHGYPNRWLLKSGQICTNYNDDITTSADVTSNMAWM